MSDNYLTMNINEFEELPFSFEGNLEGQADPMPFFRHVFSHFVDEGEEVLVIHPKSEMRKAMIHAMAQLGAQVYDAEPTDSYNYMLDVIHRRHISMSGAGDGNNADSSRGDEGARSGDSDGSSGDGARDIGNGRNKTVNIDLIAGSSETLKGLLKHSAEISTSKILVTDRFVPPALIDALKEAWGCRVFIHYTRPELAGLGAISLESEGGMLISNELYIEIVDPETGMTRPEGRWGEIVVTSIFPAKYPLVRYRTGDISRIIETSTTSKLDRVRNQTEGVF